MSFLILFLACHIILKIQNPGTYCDINTRNEHNHRPKSGKDTGKRGIDREKSPKSAWYRLPYTSLSHTVPQLSLLERASELVTPTGKHLTMTAKMQLLNLLLLVIMHNKCVFKRGRNFSHPVVKQRESSLRAALQGCLVSAAKSSVVWCDVVWLKREEMPSGCRRILIPFKYPLSIHLSPLSPAVLPLSTPSPYHNIWYPDHLPSILLGLSDQYDENLSFFLSVSLSGPLARCPTGLLLVPASVRQGPKKMTLSL